MTTDLFPPRTAAEYTLSSNEKVWVQTLNSRHQQEVHDACDAYALSQCESWLEGGADHPRLKALFARMDAERAAAYLAGALRDTYWREAFEAHPEPDKPEQGKDEQGKDESILEYATRVKVWEGACGEVEAARVKLVEARYEQERQQALALSAKERRRRCEAARFGEEYDKHYRRKIDVAVLFFAVRHIEARAKRHFSYIEEIEDLPDEDFAGLCALYRSFQPSKSVPT